MRTLSVKQTEKDLKSRMETLMSDIELLRGLFFDGLRKSSREVSTSPADKLVIRAQVYNTGEISKVFFDSPYFFISFPCLIVRDFSTQPSLTLLLQPSSTTSQVHLSLSLPPPPPLSLSPYLSLTFSLSLFVSVSVSVSLYLSLLPPPPLLLHPPLPSLVRARALSFSHIHAHRLDRKQGKFLSLIFSYIF